MKLRYRIVFIAVGCMASEPYAMSALALTKPPQVALAAPRFNLTFEEKKLLADVVVIPLLSAAMCWTVWHYTMKSPKKQHGEYTAGHVATRFTDVAGADKAKEALATMVDYLRNPEPYLAIGAELPRGILLTGDSGNGKTLLARALAGEAGCTFFSASGASFVEQYIGVGPMRVRELFHKARAHAPSIIFIDEIDAVGQKRSTRDSAQEANNTLNQLLIEMDGFDSQQYPIIVVGATNRPDILDPALVRPGRLGNQVVVPYPDATARLALFKLYVDEKHCAHGVDIDFLAQETHAFSGADIKELVNETKLRAVRKKQTMVQQSDLLRTMLKMKINKKLMTREQAEEYLKKHKHQQLELVH